MEATATPIVASYCGLVWADLMARSCATAPQRVSESCRLLMSLCITRPIRDLEARRAVSLHAGRHREDSSAGGRGGKYGTASVQKLGTTTPQFQNAVSRARGSAPVSEDDAAGRVVAHQHIDGFSPVPEQVAEAAE